MTTEGCTAVMGCRVSPHGDEPRVESRVGASRVLSGVRPRDRRGHPAVVHGDAGGVFCRPARRCGALVRHDYNRPSSIRRVSLVTCTRGALFADMVGPTDTGHTGARVVASEENVDGMRQRARNHNTRNRHWNRDFGCHAEPPRHRSRTSRSFCLAPRADAPAGSCRCQWATDPSGRLRIL